ncbi:UDP-N-acetylmuramoyl-tripeptide--D-alanyl-D-alanine ligase [Candidatus Fokinia crypta]|uniref:UDP-N-acetylmuramoyl-tripeptide--D-alanyl-D-alanine ligase n=1 Tax=Candidatus Fokinia crypta TaxID=1920990 RepID=A0ABZ0USE0_9RICK|nr:UDP-N-acetylmuramoyl-tripeptide--D-alanyl-D-alanine ligase [Candidatus Fokinia cryptica]WPX97949.1 UDP-N-acetylmuramoyl-tripeptide--D-alanyl-D-alanine ligase [Candidatus Fokinia cryptica]
MLSLKTVLLILSRESITHEVFKVSKEGVFKYESEDIPLSFFSFSSNDIRRDTIFIGLYGSRHNGSNFACDAIRNGAKVVLINTKKPIASYDSLGEHSAFVILTKDTMRAFYSIAQYKRNIIDGIVICITGSYGKTTIKEMIVNSLNRLFVRIYDQNHTYAVANEGNKNTMISLMQTLCNANENLDCLVLELGMSSRGEIRKMVTLAKPHIAMLVSISNAHFQSFNTVQDICQAKCEIFKHKDSLCILNTNMNSFEKIYKSLKKCKREIVLYGSASTEYKLRNFTSHLVEDDFSTDVEAVICGRTMKYKIGDIGAHIVENSIASICAISCICRMLTVDYENILLRYNHILSGFKALQGRGAATFCKIKTGRFLLLDESYNNPPNAIMAAIDRAIVFAEAMNSRAIAVLGDMAELGTLAEEEHTRALTYVANSNLELVFLIGENMEKALSEIVESKQKIQIFSTYNELLNEINNTLRENDVLVVKGARNMALNRIVEAFIKDPAQRLV